MQINTEANVTYRSGHWNHSFTFNQLLNPYCVPGTGQNQAFASVPCSSHSKTLLFPEKSLLLGGHRHREKKKTTKKKTASKQIDRNVLCNDTVGTFLAAHD